MKATQPIAIVLDKFCRIAGCTVRVVANDVQLKGQTIGAEIEIKAGTQRTRFFVEQKNEFREGMLPAIQRQKSKQHNWLLVCQYIPGPAKQALREMGINYVEAAGNCFIRAEGMLYFINDQAMTAYRLVKEGKLWTPTGLKFVFALLQLPAIINLPQRRLAFTAGIALGNIGGLLDELEDNGFLIRGKKDNKKFYQLTNNEELMRKWAEMYAAVLKPKLKRGKFRFADGEKWETRLKPISPDMYWGGEPAGAALTNYLRPEQFTLYTNAPIPLAMKNLKLLPDEQGNLEVLDIFWNTEVFNLVTPHVVPPLVAYADLINHPDSRNRETAERIKRKYLETK